jgi:hypothetical protein
MKIISATWYDAFNQEFLVEYFESYFDAEQILDFYADQKSIFGRKIIADYAHTRVFSDGTRVILRLCEVKSKIESQADFGAEGVIDVGPKQKYKYLPGDF